MQNAGNPSDHSDARQKGDDHAFQPLLRWIIQGGLLVVIALAIYSYFYPYVAERFKFWAGTSMQALILTAILVQVYIYKRQWEAMREQRNAMREQLEALKDQAEIFDQQRRIMRSQVRQVYKQVDLMRDGLTETRNLVIQTELAVGAAKRSVEVAQENTIHAQRAWVTIPHVNIVPIFPSKAFHLTVKNSGNTPANDVQIYYAVEMRDHPFVEGERGKPLTPRVIGLIGPGAHVMSRAIAPSEVVDVITTPERQRLIEEGSLKLYCWGIIQYRDIFDQARTTAFNFVEEDGLAGPCETWNAAE